MIYVVSLLKQNGRYLRGCARGCVQLVVQFAVLEKIWGCMRLVFAVSIQKMKIVRCTRNSAGKRPECFPEPLSCE